MLAKRSVHADPCRGVLAEPKHRCTLWACVPMLLCVDHVGIMRVHSSRAPRSSHFGFQQLGTMAS
eukprot:8423527-Alexandrium_andersonii.AAC.1